MGKKGWSLGVRDKGDYLHFTVTGANSRANVVAYLEEVRVRCAERHCQRALIEERLEGRRLNAADVFGIASWGSIRALGAVGQVAYVDVFGQGPLMKWASKISWGRGLPVWLFETVAEAEAWLREPRKLSGAAV
jgi:hypothetical protein